jgi:RNA polymerase sigma-70 factor (ECF subfamily)
MSERPAPLVVVFSSLPPRVFMNPRFATTSWTQVLLAREAPSTEAHQALEGLCRAYWYPLYAFVRRQGYGPEESRDLTQSYFAQLLEKDYLGDFDPSLGRFRVFLQASVKNFLSNERDKKHALKRGGHTQVVSLNDDEVEGRYRYEPADRLTPEEIFERRWALTVLERVMERLSRELSESGRGEEFQKLKGFLTGDGPKVPYRQIAHELRTSEEAVKTSVHRLRQKFGTLLRQEIAETVSTPEEIDDEIRHLLKKVASGS